MVSEATEDLSKNIMNLTCLRRYLVVLRVIGRWNRMSLDFPTLLGLMNKFLKVLIDNTVTNQYLFSERSELSDRFQQLIANTKELRKMGVLLKRNNKLSKYKNLNIGYKEEDEEEEMNEQFKAHLHYFAYQSDMQKFYQEKNLKEKMELVQRFLEKEMPDPQQLREINAFLKSIRLEDVSFRQLHDLRKKCKPELIEKPIFQQINQILKKNFPQLTIDTRVEERYRRIN